MTDHPVRTRYAPSPTGEPHLGNIRTALYDWLLARHYGGQFILRIEDTDQQRYAEGGVEALFSALRWLGLEWDEGPDVGGPHGPYVQSERLELYNSYTDRLLAQDNAYQCYCSPERLAEVRKQQQARKEPPRYDRRCRDLTPEQRAEAEASGVAPVVRFKTPLTGETVAHDVLRGDIVFKNETLDDFVLMKSDGYPTYHLAAIVDDHLMEITHVIRSDEWLPSAPRHFLIYQAFGWEPPLIAHVSRVLGPDKTKLSKRHGAHSVLDYREQGFLPDAVINFLALLGWSLDDHTEIIDRQTLVQHFDLDRVLPNPAVFNQDKLLWMNGMYIRQMPPETLADVLRPIWRTPSVPASTRRCCCASFRLCESASTSCPRSSISRTFSSPTARWTTMSRRCSARSSPGSRARRRPRSNVSSPQRKALRIGRTRRWSRRSGRSQKSSG